MSHFIVCVIVPECAPSEIEARVSAALAPFDENLEVPEYDQECYCVGAKAQRDAGDAAEAAYPIERTRAAMKLAMGDKQKRLDDLRFMQRKLTPEEKAEFRRLAAEIDAMWATLMEPRNKVMSDAHAVHPMQGKPDADCDECHGGGTYRSTRNPNAQWDWYVIGGRWAGWMRGVEDIMPEQPNMFQDRAGYESARAVRDHVATNSISVSALPQPLDDDRIPFAILAPDGEWHERGEMGWFGMAHNEKADWKDTARAIFDKYREGGFIAVGVDCHI